MNDLSLKSSGHRACSDRGYEKCAQRQSDLPRGGGARWNGVVVGKAQERTDRRSGPRDWSIPRSWRQAGAPTIPGAARLAHAPEAHAAGRREEPAHADGAVDGLVDEERLRQAGATSTSTNDVKLDWSLNTGGTGSSSATRRSSASTSPRATAATSSTSPSIRTAAHGAERHRDYQPLRRLPRQSGEPDADGEVRAPPAVRHRHVADAEPRRHGALRDRVAELGQRRADSARDQRQQHHDESGRLQFHDRRLDLGAHAGGADRPGYQRAAVRS